MGIEIISRRAYGCARTWIAAALLAAGLVGPATLAHAQLLDRASSAVRGDDSSSDDSSSDDDDDDDDYQGSSYDDDDGGLIGSASRAARSGSGGSGGGASGGRDYDWGGRSRGGGGFVWGSGHVFCAYPYAEGARGVARLPEGEEGGRVAARYEFELGYALGGAFRGGASARLQLPVLLDLVARYSLFVEPLEGTGVQLAALGRAGAELRVVDLPVLQLRIGGGLRHFQDGQGGLFGGDAVIGMDVFPGEPIVLSFEAGAGVVGEAVVAQARATIGVTIDGFEIYGGYDYEGLFAGGNHVDLGGPMLGLRIWQ